MKKIIYLLSATVILLAGCKKAEFLGTDPTGEGLVDFTLITPSSGTALILNAATPLSTVSFSWNAAKPGLTTAPTYKVVAALKTGGDLNSPFIEFDVPASATSLSLTQKQIDDALKAKSIADGVKTDFIWSVKATNGSVSILSTSIFNISITRMKDGASPFILLGPTSTLSSQSINPNSTADIFTFNWTKSKPATGGPATTYKVLFAERKVDANGNELPVNWSAPLFSIAANSAGVDSFAKVTYKALSDSMFKYGFTTLPTPVALKWTVVATSGTWSQLSDYSNSIVIIREVKIFIVGSATPNGWDASKAIRMIPDETNFGTFYIYVYLVGGQEMKFLNMQAFPPAAGAVDWGQNPALPAGNLTADNETNIPVAVSGVYRVTFDLTNLKYYIQTGRMATVGDATPQSWNPPTVFPTQALTFIGTNKFLGIVPFVGGNQFKMIDDNFWPSGGGPVSQPRDYGKGATDEVMLESGEGNIPGPAAGNRRIVWDASNVLALKYSSTQAKVFLIGGDAAIGNWNNSPSTALPEMTYLGNGLWTVNVTIGSSTAFKFIVEKGVWSYQYGDGGGGKAQFRNGDSDPDPNAINISAGPHTITLNEYTGTYTII